MDSFFRQSAAELEEFLEFMEEDLENVRRVISFCEEKGLEADFIVHAKSETVEESAENTGTDPEKIVKTLVFITGDQPVAVLCPGDSRVDEHSLENITGEEVRMANPSEVKDATGYTVGGVSPFDLEVPVYMEKSILEHSEVKPAAGSRVVDARLDPEELKEATGAETGDFVG